MFHSLIPGVSAPPQLVLLQIQCLESNYNVLYYKGMRSALGALNIDNWSG